jgi:ribosomal protein S26
LLLQDKAIKRYSVRNVVEPAAMRDLQEACLFDGIVSMHSAFDLFHLGLFELLDLDR